MNAGRLRHRVTLQVPTRDPAFGSETVWADYATVWAAVEPLRGREFYAAQQVASEVTGKITLRYLAGVAPEMRVLWGSRIYEILSPPIDPEERHLELQLLVREVTP